MDWVKLKQTQDELQELIDEVRQRVIRLPSGKKSELKRLEDVRNQARVAWEAVRELRRMTVGLDTGEGRLGEDAVHIDGPGAEVW